MTIDDWNYYELRSITAVMDAIGMHRTVVRYEYYHDLMTRQDKLHIGLFYRSNPYDPTMPFSYQVPDLG